MGSPAVAVAGAMLALQQLRPSGAQVSDRVRFEPGHTIVALVA